MSFALLFTALISEHSILQGIPNERLDFWDILLIYSKYAHWSWFTLLSQESNQFKSNHPNISAIISFSQHQIYSYQLLSTLPMSMGQDSHSNVFFRPILLSRKKAKGPAKMAPNGNKGPIQSAASSLTPLKSQPFS